MGREEATGRERKMEAGRRNEGEVMGKWRRHGGGIRRETDEKCMEGERMRLQSCGQFSGYNGSCIQKREHRSK